MNTVNFDNYSDGELYWHLIYAYKDEYDFNFDLMKRILKIKDILDYQKIIFFINNQNSYFASEIDEKKDRQLDELVKSYKDKKINFLKDSEISNIKNIICYRFFKECYNDISLNCGEMLDFIKKSENQILSNKSLCIYKIICNMDKFTTKDLLILYERFLKIAQKTDLVTIYYDDYRKCVDSSHELLCKNLTNFEEDKNSKVAGNFIVHELRGQPFGMLITCGEIFSFFGKTNFIKKQEELFNKGIVSFEGRYNETATSLSYLDENFIKSNWEGTVIGFKKNNIKPEQIIATNPYDLATFSRGFNQINFDYTRVITTPKDLSRRTEKKGHNEIIYRCRSNDMYFDDNELNNNLEALVPAYIICYNKIKKKDFEIAEEIQRKFGIKLEFIVIDERKYKNNVHYETAEEKRRRENRYYSREF